MFVILSLALSLSLSLYIYIYIFLIITRILKSSACAHLLAQGTCSNPCASFLREFLARVRCNHLGKDVPVVRRSMVARGLPEYCLSFARVLCEFRASLAQTYSICIIDLRELLAQVLAQVPCASPLRDHIPLARVTCARTCARSAVDS